MEASRGSPAWWSFVQVDIGKEEPNTLEEIDPHWRAMWWLQVAIQGITNEEVPWHELVAPLTSGVEGMAMSLAKHLVAAWWWNIRVQGEGECPPAPSILNIGQFIMDEEVAGGVGEPHWFVPYSCTLQENGSGQGGKPWRLKPPHWYMCCGIVLHLSYLYLPLIANLSLIFCALGSIDVKRILSKLFFEPQQCLLTLEARLIP